MHFPLRLSASISECVLNDIFFFPAISLSPLLAFVFPQLYLFEKMISNVNTKKLHLDIRYILISSTV